HGELADMRVGILTGGGDCPGLNPVIVGVVRKGIELGYDMVGVLKGWLGMVENLTMPLDRKAVSGILQRGGTILKTSRTNPYRDTETAARVKENFDKIGLDALICVGGDDTLGAASKLYADGCNAVGIPKTIDNDLSGTDRTFGFDTAVNIAMDALDRLHTTAESHSRVLVAELMGRKAGWITLCAGMAAGADVILIPEVGVSLDDICGIIRE
ncbi:unnamed protein product, partial [marine sediment metagenome]